MQFSANADERALPVVYRGDMVAIALRDRCHILVDLDDSDLCTVLAMCLFRREISEGRAPGPFTSEKAERWASIVLCD